MIILGIDPGLATVGYGVIGDNRGKCSCIDYGTIKTSKDMRLPDRLLHISEATELLINKFRPDAVAVEELFFNTNVKTAIVVAHARGVILNTVVKAQTGLFEYTPLQIKQGLTGYGRADKMQIQQMVKVLLKLDKLPRPDDAADALAVALCHSQSKSFSAMFRV